MRFIFKKIDSQSGKQRSNLIIAADRQIKPHNLQSIQQQSVAKFGIRELRKLASQVKIPNRQVMSKEQLAEALDRYFAAARIWIAWRSSYQRKLAKERTVSSPEPLNSAPTLTQPARTIANNLSPEGEIIDPITLEPLEQPVWIYSLDCGKSVHYSLSSLVEYLVCSKNFVDPITGLAFTDQHLRELDEATQRHQIRAPNLLLLSRSAQPQQQRIEQSLITGLERLAGEYIENFRKMIEMEPPYLNKQRTAEEFNLRMHKEFLNVYRHLYTADAETAIICIKQWCEFLKGPSINPSKDPAKFLQPIVNWLLTLIPQSSSSINDLSNQHT